MREQRSVTVIAHRATNVTAPHIYGPRMPSLANPAEMRELDKVLFLDTLSRRVASSVEDFTSSSRQ